MERQLSPKLKKWLKKCLNDEFAITINDNLNSDCEPSDIALKLVNSNKITEFISAIRSSFIIKVNASKANKKNNSAFNLVTSSCPQTSLSLVSDFSGEDWSMKGNVIKIKHIIYQMSCNKPDHVRLAGYESLLNSELTNICETSCWEMLLKILKDGLIDESRSIFEASLLIHAKLLNSFQCKDTYMNLLNSIIDQYYSKKLANILPTIYSGFNLKFFLHEKLFRIIKLIIDYHEEILKRVRMTNTLIEEIVEEFIVFISSHITISTVQTKHLNILHVLSVIEPQAAWSKKWLHSLTTRKAFFSAISKSPKLIKYIITCVKSGLENPPLRISVTVTEEPSNVFISGDSVELFTFLHCLNLLTYLCNHSTGQILLLEAQTENSFSILDFVTAILCSLNVLATSGASSGIYEAIRTALSCLLEKHNFLYDARFYRLAINPLLQVEIRIWPHTLDIFTHMLNTIDGPMFLMTEYRVSSSSLDNQNPNYPIVLVLAYASDLLKQPISVMNINQAVELFIFIKKVFNIHGIFYIIEQIIREQFYPSVTYLYSKLQNYYIENENKTQNINKIIIDMLLNLVSIPLGLYMLSNEPIVLEELIRGSISPIRTTWNSYNIVSFISNCVVFTRGSEILSDLAPHVLSTLLIELSKLLQNPQQFYDPWDNDVVKVFLHVISLFSLNANCFASFMTRENQNTGNEQSDYLTNLFDVFEHFMNVDSLYHYLGLLVLKSVIWNLDIYIYLLNLIDFQNKMSKIEEYGHFIKVREFDKPVHIVDENSLLRHELLLNCYYLRHRTSSTIHSTIINSERRYLYPSVRHDYLPKVLPNFERSKLTIWLQDSTSYIRDNSWILQTRKAYKASPEPIGNSILLILLEQMEKAIPTLDWMDRFKWDSILKCSKDWLPEENHGIDLMVHYGLVNGLIEKNEKTKLDLKVFIQASHDLINYKSKNFESFDWFLATVFLICNGNLDKAKIFVNQILRFPSAVFMWPALAHVVDKNNQEEASTRLLFANLLESIISQEFPALKLILKNESGIDWWMICNRLLAQCFLGILPWNEITHYFAVCILHPPDYMLYYCTALLHFCRDKMMSSIIKGNMLPEYLVLEDFHCHNQLGFMDRLGKRYGGKVLPSLIQRKLYFPDAFN